MGRGHEGRDNLRQPSAAPVGNSRPEKGSEANEELFRLMVEAVQDQAFFLLNPDGIIISWNMGAQRIKQYTADEVIGKHFSMFYLPEDRATKPMDHLRVAARDGILLEQGWRLRRDGARLGVSVIITALRDREGNCIGFSKVTRDLTEVRAAEEAYRLSEQRFLLMIDGIPDSAIFLLDEFGTIKTWNSGAERIQGYKASEIIGKHFSVFYPLEQRREEEAARELAIVQTKGKFEEEGWRMRQDGGLLWANTIVTPIKDQRGKIIGYANVTRDLTKQRAAEESARLSQARYEGIVRISEDAIISLDDQRRISLFNQGAEKIFGYQPAEILGRSIETLIPGRFSDAHRKHVANFAASPDTLRPMNERRSLYGLRKDGSEFPAEASISKFQVENETVLTVRLRDVTEQKRAEEQIRASLNEKEVMLKEIHHRVKNNLQVVSSLLNLQSGYPRVETVKDLFVESQNRVSSMALIHEKLYQSDDLANIDFSEYIESLAQNLFHSYSAKPDQVTLTTDVKARLDIDHAIPCGLIVNELLSNSLKHAFPAGRKGKIHLTFRASGAEFKLQFHDDGIGLPLDLDVQKTETLGLQLVTTLAHQLRGTVRISSKLGTEFEIKFPAPARKAVGA
jgi:PAS domain S-box-containing protein